jgi:DNA invertase Pin-like site-specific DNA recombinase
MRELLPLMGERRQLQIRRALASYNPYLRYKLRPEQLAEIRRLLVEGCTHTEIAMKYGVHRSTVSHIKAGVRKAYK